MADHEDRAAEALEPHLQPFDRRDVQMVGRLVEQEHIRIADQRLGKGHPAPFAAREIGEQPITRHADLGQGLVDPVPPISLAVAEAGCDVVGDGHRRIEHGLLGHIGDMRPGLDESFALVEFDHAGERLQQGRLAAAVAPDEAGSLALHHRYAGLGKGRTATEGDRGIAQGQLRRGGGHQFIARRRAARIRS